jgi:hypothetical protein
MNVRQVFALLAIGVAGNVAMAAETLQASEASANPALAEIAVECLQAADDLPLMSGGEATASVDRPVA